MMPFTTAGFRIGLAGTLAVWLWAVGGLAMISPAEPAFRAAVDDASRALWVTLGLAVALAVPWGAGAAAGWRDLAAGSLALLAVPAPLVLLAVLMGVFDAAQAVWAAAALVAGTAVLAVLSRLVIDGLRRTPWRELGRGVLQFAPAAALVLYHRQILERILG
jgi:hypothetical protein